MKLDHYLKENWNWQDKMDMPVYTKKGNKNAELRELLALKPVSLVNKTWTSVDWDNSEMWNIKMIHKESNSH